MKLRLLFYLLPVTAILLTSCKQEDLTPCWVKVDSVILQTEDVSQGSNTHGITDLWVFDDNEAIGVWEVGSIIPVVGEGTSNFIFRAGVKKNGIAASRVQYPFYNSFSIDLNLVRGDTISVTPIFTYREGTEFSMIEDFEDTGIDFTAASNSDTSIQFIYEATDPDLVEYGEKCGGIFLTETDSFFRAGTDLKMPIPIGESYLEIDYKNDHDLDMGFISHLVTGTSEDQGGRFRIAAQQNETPTWKKIYIELSDYVGFFLNQFSSDIYFAIYLAENFTEANIYIDNIKVVHF